MNKFRLANIAAFIMCAEPDILDISRYMIKLDKFICIALGFCVYLHPDIGPGTELFYNVLSWRIFNLTGYGLFTRSAADVLRQKRT